MNVNHNSIGIDCYNCQDGLLWQKWRMMLQLGRVYIYFRQRTPETTWDNFLLPFKQPIKCFTVVRSCYHYKGLLSNCCRFNAQIPTKSIVIRLDIIRYYRLFHGHDIWRTHFLSPSDRVSITTEFYIDKKNSVIRFWGEKSEWKPLDIMNKRCKLCRYN